MEDSTCASDRREDDQLSQPLSEAARRRSGIEKFSTRPNRKERRSIITIILQNFPGTPYPQQGKTPTSATKTHPPTLRRSLTIWFTALEEASSWVLDPETEASGNVDDLQARESRKRRVEGGGFG